MMETVLYDDYNSMHNNFLASAAGMNNQLKRKLTLDLDFGSGGDGSGIGPKQMSVIKKAKVASLNTPSSLAILSSPDLYKLNLASPELEKLVIQQALTLPTPNPTQSQIFFPKNVTEEQEAYVQGFTEALSKLHQNPPVTSINNNLVGAVSNSMLINTSTSIQPLTTTAAGQLTQEQQQQLQILQLNNNVQRLAEVQQPPPYSSSYDNDTTSSEEESMSENSCSNSTSSSVTYSSSGHIVLPTTIPSMLNSAHAAFPVVTTSANNSNMHHRLPEYSMGANNGGATGSSGNIAAIPISTAGYNSSGNSPQTVVVIKEEPQIVPNLSSPAPVSPIDMESQEKIKLERKRQRNRLAASKCRKRKLERISKLEDKVKQLKGENGDLSTVLAKLKDTVCSLKQQVMDHVSSGCHIIISPTLSSTF